MVAVASTVCHHCDCDFEVMDECFTEMEHHLAAEQEKVKDTRSQAIKLGIWRFRTSGELMQPLLSASTCYSLQNGHCQCYHKIHNEKER